MKSRMVRIAAALSVAAIALVGCSSDHSDAVSNAGPDVAFAQMMIPHHEQAIVMSNFALSISENPEILALAAAIKAEQDPEIAQMNGFLERFGADSGGHEGHTMAGMLTDDQLAELESARGPEFDRLFLTGMIAHHEGAIEMAEDVLAEGSDPEVLELAQQIITAQQAEIAEMNGLLTQ
jgi:uncharacterized protein (DUF305 family)